MQERSWSMDPPEEIALELGTHLSDGLAEDVAAGRTEAYGKNILTEEKERTLADKIVDQFKNPLVFVLLLAGAATLVLQEFIDAVVIFIALLINVSIGTIQEERASKAFQRLNESQERHATVIRNGRKYQILAEALVPGDLVSIEAGSQVPADMRLIDARDLTINEAALTGEWVAVGKYADTLTEKKILIKQENMAFMGTLVVNGHAIGIVTETGDETYMGSIAGDLQNVESRLSPIQLNIKSIANFLVYFISAALILIFALGLLRGETFQEMLLIAIALSVAAIPQGLPAAVTAVLALGMEKILGKGGLVRSLVAAETLGSTTTILTDKTGTLTEAKMKVDGLHAATSKHLDIKELSQDERYLLQGAVLASDAFVEKVDGEEGGFVVHGRPVEKAILIAGLDAGLSQEDLKTLYPQQDFLNFSSDRRFGAALVGVPRKKTNRLFMSGSPEHLLEVSTHAYEEGKDKKISESKRRALDSYREEQSALGKRLIGVAYRDVSWSEIPECKEDHPGAVNSEAILKGKIVFLGYITLVDPVREDVPPAISLVKKAHVRVIMVTGDSPITARAIAEEAGICGKRANVLTGVEIEHMSDAELLEALQHTSVFARVLPTQKLRIANILKNNGDIVAMTGDGINDAPALRAADIGVAVGSGTEVAKEASDIVLLNNSFSIIVEAIRIGRSITNNLKKIVAYLVSTSFSGVAVVGSSLLLGLPIPVLPTQILWANIVEEGLMSFAFAFEPNEKGLMQKNPRSPEIKKVLTDRLRKLILVSSVLTGGFLVGLYVVLSQTSLPIEEVRTMMFVALTLDSLFFAFSLKSLEKPIWNIPFWNNRYLLFAFVASVALLVAALTFPPLQLLLSTTALTPFEIVLLGLIGLFNLVIIELMKYIYFGRNLKMVQ